jgi:N-acetyl-gamma-glutamyl-phosphate reductase/acetylglutamate kinase
MFEFDVRKVGQEMRKRGLLSSAQARDGGMDRVSPSVEGNDNGRSARVIHRIPTTSTQDTIIRLLYSLGSRHEVERYLRIFTSSTAASGKSGGVLPEAKFAVLK